MSAPSKTVGLALSSREKRTNLWKQIRTSENFNIVVVYIVLFLLLSLFVPYFFSLKNMLGLGLSVSQIGMVACTMMFCLASKDFDLSVGSQVAFYGVLTALIVNTTDNFVLGVIGAVIAGVFIGLANGIFVTKIRVNALIATLAMMEIVRGAAYIISGGNAVGVVNMDFFMLGQSSILGLPTPIVITILCFLAFGFLLKNTAYGRNALAVGGNCDAAKLAGVDIDKVRIANFMIQGIICAIAGIILASRITSGQPNASLGFELSVISACVLGGVSLNGGKASIIGVVIGVLIMGTVENALNLLNIDSFYQYLVRGGILLLAVGADQYRQRLTEIN
ncbi:L-arabinose ABC transporter permease AraH [Vibrio mimicus]|uniref:L-arabinose ABC transporter permease AraH n=1 Tax=Vibrio mimicus TaxID=674 RepID=UPI0011DA7326|nr:L-arabinose ABC transporter permease AraH [Vibrio mimicus]TXZ75234.1 L-arabinose ABC transporter permease AraH [Vibrio mimicus]